MPVRHFEYSQRRKKWDPPGSDIVILSKALHPYLLSCAWQWKQSYSTPPWSDTLFVYKHIKFDKRKSNPFFSAPLWPCLCLCIMYHYPSFFPSFNPSFLFPSLPSSPQSHVCAPWFIPGSFWRGVPRRTEWGAGQPRRFWWGPDSLPTNQCSSQRLLPKPHGE